MYLRACPIIVLKNILQKIVISVTRGLKLCFRGLRPCVSRSFAASLSKLSGRSERRESAAMTRCAVELTSKQVRKLFYLICEPWR